MFKFELSEQMVTIIGKALGAQPFDLVAPVIAELQKQINAQQRQNGPQPIDIETSVETTATRQ